MRINYPVVALSTFALAVAVCVSPMLSMTLASPVAGDPSCLVRQDEVRQPARASYDTTLCLSCHANNGASEFVTKFQSDRFIQINVRDTWHERDLHARSLEILKKSELASRMYQVLGYADEAARAQNCYTCHGLDKAPERTLTGKVEQRFDLSSSGIVCATCHGAGKAWQTEHYNVEDNKLTWRIEAPKTKAAMGFIDLREPQTKTSRCASCHIGNAAEGKVVTHEMYAAGHPPLPPFEVVTFMESQPAHWKHPSEMPYLKELAGKDAQASSRLFHYRPEEQELHQARELAVGVIASFQTSMKLIADQALHPGSNGLMDFAHFDCYACHHDLRVPSDRQRRGYRGAPGRPPLKAWTSVLPRIVIEHAGQMPGGEKLQSLKSELGARYQALDEAVQSQPFGNPARVSQAASRLVEWSQLVLSELEQVRYSREQSTKLLDLIVTKGTMADHVADPEAAWQVAWATNVLSRELSRGSNDFLAPYRPELAKLVPLRIRPEPDSTDKRPLGITEDGRLARRQKQLSDFPLDAYLKLFGEMRRKSPEQNK